MDLPKRVLHQGERATRSSSPRRNPKATRPKAMDVDENVSPECSVAAGAASTQRKVLGQRNSGGGREGASTAVYQPKAAPSPPSLGGRGAGTYDPKTNYTTPRPKFLRYNPERTREIRRRLECEVDDESSSTTSGTVASEAVSSCSSARGSDSECDDVDEEEVVPVHRGGWARRLFLLLVVVACSFCYIYFISSVPFPASPEEHPIVSLLEPVDMSVSENVFEAAGGQVMVHMDSDDFVHLHGPGDSPINFMVIATMGLADVCPNVPFGELTCQIGDESSENVIDLKEGSDLGEQKAEVIDGSFESAEDKVAFSGADAIEDSIASIHCSGMEEAKLQLINQPEGEDNSNHFMPQLVFVEKILESKSDKLDNEEGLESEFDQESELWEEYENTAGAAKAICFAVKKWWPSMKAHFLQMLACLSMAGFAAVMFKYSQRTCKAPVRVAKRIPSVPPTQVSVLDPPPSAELSVFPSLPAVELPMFPSEQHVQSPLPKPDPSVSLQVPLIIHGNRDQKIQQGASDISAIDHKEIDSSKPPVVELLGEFSCVDASSSRWRSNKDSNLHGGDATILESLSSKNYVVKMQKEPSKIRSPGVQRSIKKENAEVEKTDTTPTPLRRSSRVRKLTSP